MSNLSENSFENLSKGILDRSETLSLWLMGRLRRIALRLIGSPDVAVSVAGELEDAAAQHEGFFLSVRDLIDEELPVAYLRGAQDGNGTGTAVGAEAVAGSFRRKGLLLPNLPGMEISGKAARILENYPAHHTMYSVFQQAAYQDFANTRVPVVREQEDRIRRLTTLASESSYRDADTFTRRDMSQRIMRGFSDEGITGIRYSDGRTMKLDSYSEMVARTQTGNAARQANLNRLQEYGLDLVQISQHYPCSDLCVDWQGKVYSISGESGQYPSLQTALDGGLYHASCKHFQSGYVPGTSKLPEKEFTKTENKQMYEAQKTQRHNERQIKSWRRREASAVDPRERDKAKAKIREWQKQNRELINDNDFLRRKYEREAI